MIGKRFKTIGIGAFNGIYSGEIQILNPACEIAGGNGNERVTIAGYDKSTAQAFAEKYGFQFRLIGEKNPFGDVKSDSWQLKAANYCLEKNLMAGKGKLEDGSIKFDPDMNMTRAEFAQVLYNVEGKPPVEYDGHFPDVEDGKWYTNAITWAYQNNIVSGTGKGTFNVTGMINRQEMATMLKKYAAFKNFDVDSRAELSAFKDADSISPWAVENMKWAIAKNIMKGKGDVIDALGKATRAECAAMLKNFCDTFGQ